MTPVPPLKSCSSEHNLPFAILFKKNHSVGK